MLRKVRTSWKDVPNPPEAMYAVSGIDAWEIGYRAAVRAYHEFSPAPMAEMDNATGCNPVDVGS